MRRRKSLNPTTRFLDIPKVKIDPEFQGLIPMATKDEKAGLEASILAEGCRDPLIVWNQGDILLDGYTRLAICQKHKIDFKVTKKSLESREQAKIWIITNQLARRNLTPQQTNHLRGARYNLEHQEHGGQIPGSLGKTCPSISTAKKLAEEYGVSERTIKNDAKFAEAVNKLPPEERAEVLSGKSKRTKAEIINAEKGKEDARPRLGPPCDGMQFAQMAVRDLEKIRQDDSQRKQAFAFVKGWIAENE
jgi:hypothetical protein